MTVMKRVSFLPSLLTVGNFTCGFVGISLCLQSTRLYAKAQTLQGLERFAAVDGRAAELLTYACFSVVLAMVFDVLDGRVARMTGAVSRFGGELDSLADDCSFGVLPATIVTTMWIQAQPPGRQWYGLVLFCGAIYAACAIIRLARYNVEAGVADHNYFTGLPSPAAAGVVVSTVLFCRKQHLDPIWAWLVDYVPQANQERAVLQAYVLGVYMLVIGVLMVTRLRFVHVANKYIGGRRRLTTFVAFIFCLGLFCQEPVWFMFITSNAYVFACIIGNIRRKLSRRGARLAIREHQSDKASDRADPGEPA